MHEIFKSHINNSKILNHFLLLSLLALIYGIIYHIFYCSYSFALMLTFFSLAFIVALYFNHKNNFNLAKHILLISTNLLILLATLTIGISAGIYFFFFPVVVAYSFLLNLKNKKELLFYSIFTMFLFLLVLIDFKELQFMKVPIIDQLNSQFEIVAFLSFLLVIYQTYLYISDRDQKQNQLFKMINDIKASENKHLQDLKDKEILLAEVYHRVKNNLSVVSSLINLQMNTIEHEFTKNALMDCKNRVNSMAMIHQKFYEGKKYAKIDFKAYIIDLVGEIKHAYNIKNKKIAVNSYIDTHLNFDLNIAIPCGIILNELISNSFKHAFSNQDTGKIDVYIERENDLFLMRIVDNGIGFEFKDKIESSNSLGLILIQSLAEQLDGTFQFLGTKGTDFRMLFKSTNK